MTTIAPERVDELIDQLDEEINLDEAIPCEFCQAQKQYEPWWQIAVATWRITIRACEYPEPTAILSCVGHREALWIMNGTLCSVHHRPIEVISEAPL